MIRNTSTSWGWPTRALHWIVAALVLGLYVHGLWMEDLPRDQHAFQIWLHAAVGATLLAFAAVGFVWWLLNAAPKDPAGTPAWQRRAAHGVYWALYALIFATVFAGWALTGTLREPVAIEMFGFIGLPPLSATGSSTHELYEEAHELFANALIALVAVHVAAALYHHFVRRDAVLWRMLAGKPHRQHR
jgi:cytochrome b561